MHSLHIKAEGPNKAIACFDDEKEGSQYLTDGKYLYADFYRFDKCRKTDIVKMYSDNSPFRILPGETCAEAVFRMAKAWSLTILSIQQ
jgi:hypothetical protein